LIQRVPELEITAMTLGPYGVAHLDGKAVLVPNAAPGDLLEANIDIHRRDHAIAHIERILRLGSDRREPPCRFLPRCGGCDWQQIAYNSQVRLKGELIAAAFARTLDYRCDARGLVEPAPAEFGYRARIRLKCDRGRLGFHEQRTNAVVPIDHCLVAVDDIRIPTELTQALGPRCSEIEVVSGARGNVLVADLTRAPTPADRASVQRIISSIHGAAGIVLRGGGARHVIGDAVISIEVETGCEIEGEADLFSQVNRAQNRKLVESVLELAALRPGMRVLDLFCGTGNLSLPSARRGADVTGVDADPLAIEAARRNAARMRLDATQFIASRATETADFLRRARYRPDLVIVDPPRVGALDLMEPIARLHAASIIYVSCEVLTLVRDLRVLLASGYRIAKVRAFDFFPNTHHAEVVAHLLLT
jgi:23S rRNA (uracil1939-C5)-methyltransferase